jgi:hypothetical protein
MAVRPHGTILLITRDRVARADFDRRGTLLGVQEQPSPGVEDFASLVETALGLARARPGRVWVLASELWVQTLTLPEETVAGLNAEDLGRAVAFEAEALSGISAPDSAVGCVAQGQMQGHRPVWLVQVSRATVEQVEYAVQQAGGRLAGLGHPGGLPRPLLDDASRVAAWQRVELWPGAIVVVRGGADVASIITVVNSDPKPGRWADDLARWLPEQTPVAHQETLHATAALGRDELAPLGSVSLDDRQGLEAFLTAWAAELAVKTPRVPLVFPARKPMSANTRWAVATVLAFVALGVCSGHYLWTQRVMAQRQAETARLNGPIQQSQAAQKDVAALAKQQKTLADACQKLEADLAHCRTVLTSQQNRLCVLLTALAQPELQDYIVQRIDSTADELVLHGICRKPHVSNDLAAALAPKVEPLGWRVDVPTKHATEAMQDYGPWQFELRIRDVYALDQPVAGKAGATKPHRNVGEE